MTFTRGRLSPIAGRRVVMLAAALSVAGVAPGAVTVAQPNPRPIPLGIHHPHPALCPGEEPSQRDLRVLRLAFDTGRTARQWSAGPWFYRIQRNGAALTGRAEVILDTNKLWGLPVWRLQGQHPDDALPMARDRLASWRAQVVRNVPSLAPSALLSRAQFEASAAGVFLAARLVQSGNMPFLTSAREKNGQAARRAFPDCRDWPHGVTLETGNDRLSYLLRRRPQGGGSPLDLHAYRVERVMWQSFRQGRLDAVLLEGQELKGRLTRIYREQVGEWGLLRGGQHIVLRLAPELRKLLAPPERLALSMALNRKALAAVPGPGLFVPASSFLEPLLENGALPPAAELRWDTLRARRRWLKQDRVITAWRLGVLDHPWLRELADNIQAQWNRTINLKMSVVVLAPDQYRLAQQRWEMELFLDVLDLDDGSLQDLWEHAQKLVRPPRPSSGSPPADIGLEALEGDLRKRLPYLPLLVNSHYLLLRKNAPPDLMPRICPGCVSTPPPLRLRRRIAPPPPRQG